MPLNSAFIAPSFGENGWKPQFPELIGAGAQGAWCAGRFTIYRSRFYYSLVPSWTGNMWNDLWFFLYISCWRFQYLQHVGSWNLSFSVFVKLLLWKHPSLTGDFPQWASYPIQASDLSPKNNSWHRCEAHRKAPVGQTLLSRAGRLISSIRSWEVFQDCRN